MQVISFRANKWQIDFVQRRFSHIYNDPAVIIAIGFGADRQLEAKGGEILFTGDVFLTAVKYS